MRNHKNFLIRLEMSVKEECSALLLMESFNRIEKQNVSSYHSIKYNVFIPIFGWCKNIKRMNLKELLFLLFSCLIWLHLFTTAVFQLSLNAHTSLYTSFYILILINLVFYLIYTIFGVFKERKLLLFTSNLTNLIILIYHFLTYNAIESPKYKVKIISMVILSFLSPTALLLGILVFYRYYKSHNYIFYLAGANIDDQKNITKFIDAFDMAIIDFNTHLNITILYTIPYSNGLNTIFSYWDKITLISATVVAISSLLLTITTLRLEIREFFIVTSIVGIIQEYFSGFIIYRTLYYIHVNQGSNVAFFCFVIIEVSCAVFTKIMMIYYLIKVERLFGKNLSRHIFYKRDQNVI